MTVDGTDFCINEPNHSGLGGSHSNLMDQVSATKWPNASAQVILCGLMDHSLVVSVQI